MKKDAPGPREGGSACPLCGEGGGKNLSAQGMPLRRCPACGTIYQAAPPADEELPEIYAESYYDSWGLSTDTSVEGMKRAIFRPLLRRLGRWAPAGKLLDIGCATGFLLAEAEALGWRAHGVELNAWAAAESARRFPGRVRQGPAESMSGDAPFRAVTLVDVIEHLPRPLRVLDHIHNLLEPGGLLLIVAPDAGSPSRRLMGGYWPHFKREHLFYPTRQGLETALVRRGFRPLDHFPVRKTVTLCYLARQFSIYQRPLLTPASRLFLRRAPSFLRDLSLSLPSGELAVIARREDPA